MRRIIIFAMILTFIFAMVGCTAHSEPDKSSSANAVIDTRRAEELTEKAENETVEKCRNDCKQSFRVIVVSCPLYCSKRSVKSVPNGNDFNDSG